MQVRFVADDPRYPMGDVLDEVLGDASSVRAAVAYCTARGVDQIEEICARCPRGASLPEFVKVVVSVRTPTNLDRLAELAKARPGVVHLHLGRMLPAEEVDRGHFHSKVVAVKRSEGRSTVLVGSHNWTALALDGHNFEAAVRVDCATSDPFARSAREHVRRCRLDRACEPFDPSRLDYYKELQRAYSWDVGGGGRGIDDFASLPTLVLHAEAADPALLTDAEIRLYLDVNLRDVRGAFAVERRFRLHLYEPGTMFTESTGSLADPVLFDGRVTMVNAAADGMVTARPITAVVRPPELRNPQVIPDVAIPPSRSPGVQVVATVRNAGQRPVPEYHLSSSRPMVVPVPAFEEELREPRRPGRDRWLTPASRRSGAVVEASPVGFRRVALVRPPVPLNAAQRQRLLADWQSVRGDEVVEYLTQPERRRWFTPWFYSASHVLADHEVDTAR